MQDGTTPLVAASRGGHSKVVKILLSEGANVNDKDKWVCTHLVCSHYVVQSECPIAIIIDPNV